MFWQIRTWFFIFSLIATLEANAQTWQRQGFGKNASWISDSGPWRAIVEARYGRLRFLGLRDGANLLHSPNPPPDLLQIGGHRIWLGPQTEWQKMWPPPKNWEMSPAKRVTTDASNTLFVRLAAGKGTDIALTRHYSWVRPGVLSCGVEWNESIPAGRQAVQIFQLENPDGIYATAKPTKSLPMGYVQLPLSNRAGIRKRFEPPVQVQQKRDSLHLTRQPTEEKLGFPVQNLRAVWPDVEMILHSGSYQGVVRGETDEGCRSQVYLGADNWPVVEIEQLSPRLGPGCVSHTVAVELNQRK